jgi:hypothetical protein
MRDALGIKAGDSVRYVISEGCVKVLRILSDDNGLKIHGGDLAARGSGRSRRGDG